MKVGILIIGSLFWDTEKGRPDWRKNHLVFKKKIKVSVPIRYGRLSNNGRTYTMVFSKGVQEKSNLGIAYLIPLKEIIHNTDELFNEAQALSKAEGNDTNLIIGHTNWAVISILFNPKSSIDKYEIETKWEENINKNDLTDFLQKHIKIEPPLINKKGVLDISWLQAIEEEQQNEVDLFDIILTTCTLPTGYLNPKQHAKIANTDLRKYFKNNQKYGILTFEDDEIRTELNKV